MTRERRANYTKVSHVLAQIEFQLSVIPAPVLVSGQRYTAVQRRKERVDRISAVREGVGGVVGFLWVINRT